MPMRRKEETQRLNRMRAALMAPADPDAGELLNEVNNLAQRIALEDPDALETDPDVARRLTSLSVRFDRWKRERKTPLPARRKGSST